MERAEAVADFGEDVTAEEEADYHRFVVPDGCHWSACAPRRPTSACASCGSSTAWSKPTPTLGTQGWQALDKPAHYIRTSDDT